MATTSNTSTSAKKKKSDLEKDTGDTGFQEVAKLMQSCFKYPVISNDEATHLIDLLDDVIYKSLETIHQASDAVVQRYEDVVRNYAFHPVAKRSSHSSRHPDTILLSSIFWINDETAQQDKNIFLQEVRSRVCLFRIFWMDFLHHVDNKLKEYRDLVGRDPSTEDFNLCQAIEDDICQDMGICDGTTYGIAQESAYAVSRMTKIIKKLTYPYLRKVVAHAKRYGMDKPQKWKENFQNGSVGIRIAIGRHDNELGAFASSVDRWINNRIMTFIRENGMLIPIPDRAFTLKNKIDKHMARNPHISVDEIAELEDVKPSVVAEAIQLVESQTAYIDLQDEDESTSKHSNSYIDRSTDNDSNDNNIIEALRDCSIALSHIDIALLTLVYGISDVTPTKQKHNKDDVLRARAEQLTALSILAEEARN